MLEGGLAVVRVVTEGTGAVLSLAVGGKEGPTGDRGFVDGRVGTDRKVLFPLPIQLHCIPHIQRRTEDSLCIQPTYTAVLPLGLVPGLLHAV